MVTLKLKIPPVAVVLIGAALMWLVARATPEFQLRIPGSQVLAVCSLLAGIVVVGFGVAAFRRVKTTVNPRQPQKASAMVITGIYRRTRNPMYLGLLLLLLAWGLFLANWPALLALPGFVFYMNRFQIAPEEAALTRLFGQAFTEYTGKVRRWL